VFHDKFLRNLFASKVGSKHIHEELRTAVATNREELIQFFDVDSIESGIIIVVIKNRLDMFECFIPEVVVVELKIENHYASFYKNNSSYGRILDGLGLVGIF
jgi:hypothetical protein